MAREDENEYVRSTAIQELASGWHDDPETLNIIKQRAKEDENENVRSTAIQESKKWRGEYLEGNIEENISTEILDQKMFK